MFSAPFFAILSLLATYSEIEDLVTLGAYCPGVNIDNDLAVQAKPKILQFLRQNSGEAVAFQKTERQLAELVAWIDQIERKLRGKPR